VRFEYEFDYFNLSFIVQGCASTPQDKSQLDNLKQAAEDLRLATEAAAAGTLRKQLLTALQVAGSIILIVKVYSSIHVFSLYLADENSTSRPMSRTISVSALLRHLCLSSEAPVFQPSVIELFRSLLPDYGTLCCRTSRRRRHWPFL